MSMLVSIDNGGTLTDACVLYGSQVFHAKTLTTPHDLTACFVEVLNEASRKIYGEPRLGALLEEVDYIRYSTTQGTNAVVQRIGPRLGLILRKGAKVEKLIRNDNERELFAAIVGDRIGEVDPALEGEELEFAISSVVNDLMARGANRLVVSLGGAKLAEDETKVKAVALLRYPRHLLGAVPILYSHQLSDDRNDARRSWSALLNSFLHPSMERFLYNAENVMRGHRAKNPLLIFCNDGTSSRVAKTVALKTWGSGPRGGMEGARALAQHYQRKTLLTMDIGGTTTDIGAIDNATVAERRWGELESIAVSFPLSEVESLGAGGSSVFKVVKGQIEVGPESVGSTPGPACFGRGGRAATMTDAYLLMGVLDADSYFGGQLKLDAARATAAIEDAIAKPLKISLAEALKQMEKAYEAKIGGAMKSLVKTAGETTLLAFGGAGPIAACGVAAQLGVSEVIVPRLAAVFSAFGIGFSDIAHAYDTSLADTSASALKKTLDDLATRAGRDMFAEGFELSDCKMEKSVHYTRGGVSAVHPLDLDANLPDGISVKDDPRAQVRATKSIPHFNLKPVDTKPKTRSTTKARRGEAPLFKLEELAPGAFADGPAIVEEAYFTCRVPEGWWFLINDNLDIVLRQGRSGK